MAEQKHFNYDGHVDLSKQNSLNTGVEVTKVEFLNPAKVTMTLDGKEMSMMVSIDIINRKVYDSSGSAVMSDIVFKYLDEVNHLPEDFFAAPEDVLDVARKANEEHRMKKDEIMGDENE